MDKLVGIRMSKMAIVNVNFEGTTMSKITKDAKVIVHRQ